MSTAHDQTAAFLNAFDQALQAGDAGAVADLFEDDSYWRDLVTFTWNIKTMEGRDAIEDIIEPYLIQHGFIQRTPRGRILTANAWKQLGMAAPANKPVSTLRAIARSRPVRVYQLSAAANSASTNRASIA